MIFVMKPLYFHSRIWVPRNNLHASGRDCSFAFAVLGILHPKAIRAEGFNFFGQSETRSSWQLIMPALIILL